MTGFFERVSRRSAGQTGAPNGVTLSLRQRSRFEPTTLEPKTVDTAEQPGQAANLPRVGAHQTTESPVVREAGDSIEAPETWRHVSLEHSALREERSVPVQHPTASAPPAVDLGTDTDVSGLSDNDEPGDAVLQHGPPTIAEILPRDERRPGPRSEQGGEVSRPPENAGEFEHTVQQGRVLPSKIPASAENTDGQEWLGVMEMDRTEPQHAPISPEVPLDFNVAAPASSPDPHRQIPAENRGRSPRNPSPQPRAKHVPNFTDEGPDPTGGLSIGQITVEFLPPPTPQRSSRPASTNRTQGFDAYARARRGILR